MRYWLHLWVFVATMGCESACPSPPGGTCDPRAPNCPGGYRCAMAEICTRPCEQTSECWVPVSDGCRYTQFPGQRLADGGIFMETSEDGFCPESKLMECLDGHCQRFECLDGGCDYDVYGPSPFKGNRNQGPVQ